MCGRPDQTRRDVRLDVVGGEIDELADLDLVWLLEVIACRPEGLAMLEKCGALARLDAKETAWRAVDARPVTTPHPGAGDGKDGRWPAIRSRLMGQA